MRKKQKLKYHDSAGFTLVEMLASIVVLIIVGFVIVSIVTSSLRGTNKTNTIENIRQVGNYILNQISKNIEYALPFDGKNTGLSNDDGLTYDTNCASSLDPTPTPVTPYSVVTIESTANAVTKYKCTSSELSANGISLVDSNSVSLISCSFSCIQNNITDIPIIKISFGIGPKTSNNLIENSSPPIVFETSVALRNYGR